jgi:hypothetical protein
MAERKTKVTLPPDNRTVEGFDVPVESSTERWTELKLEDGSILRVKPAIASIVRIPDLYDPDGNPLYVVRGSMMMSVVESPEKLQRPKRP